MDECTPSMLTQVPLADRLWFFEIIVGVLVLVAVNFLFRRVVKHVRQRSISISQNWKEKIDYIFFMPFQILLWVLGITLVIEILGRRFGFSFFENYLDAFRSSGFIVCFAWAVMRWKSVAIRDFLNNEGKARQADSGFVNVIGKVFTISVGVISMMIILQVWGLNIGPLIAFSGIGAAAAGFAGKDVIANFFGGFMLYVTRPFTIGDFIVFKDAQIEGTVEDIGWYLTTIRDKEKRPVYLPNALFSKGLVVNSSRMTHRRIEIKVGVRYEDFAKIEQLAENIKNVISEHSDIDTHLPVLVVFNDFGQYTLDLYVDVYTLKTRYDKYLKVRHEILMLVYEEVNKAGVEMPVPTSIIYNRNIPQPSEV